MKSTKDLILDFIIKNGQSTVKEIVQSFSIERRMAQYHLKSLVEQEKIEKIGKVPKIFYIPKKKVLYEKNWNSDIIEKNWLEILPNGEFLFGMKGFVSWCEERGKKIEQEIISYENLYQKKEALKKEGLIDATLKITETFPENFLTKVWYIDFYSWEIFGKTLLGKLVLYAKQNSNKILMKTIAKKIEPSLVSIIKKENFDQIIIIPHSVNRRLNFLKETLKLVELPQEPIEIFEKVFKHHSVAQKTLKSKKEREKNAEETLMLSPKSPLGKKILLIDDACGSGATLNIAAKKIKQKYPETQIFALTFVGSQNGFEVIAES